MTVRVAMVGLRAPWGVEGGVEAAVAALAPRLVREGMEVTVYCRGRYNPHGDTVREGVRLRDSPALYGRSTEAFVHTGLALPRATLGHDLVHLHACGSGWFAGLPRLAGRRTVVTLHGLDWRRQKWGPVARAVLRGGAEAAVRQADAVVAVSREVAAWVESRFPVPVHHLPNGVAPHQPVPWDPAVFPRIRPGAYVLFLGRLVPEKQVDTLIAAAARAGAGTQVVVTGGSAYTDGYLARLRAAAPPNVVFTGPRFDLEKRMLLTHARAFALPSRVEGLPIALLEGLAAGLPALVSHIAPHLEVLGDVDAWRLPVGDVAAWARALSEVAAAPESQRRAMGEAGRRRVEAHFDWDVVAARTAALYRALLGRPG